MHWIIYGLAAVAVGVLAIAEAKQVPTLNVNEIAPTRAVTQFMKQHPFLPKPTVKKETK